MVWNDEKVFNDIDALIKVVSNSMLDKEKEWRDLCKEKANALKNEASTLNTRKLMKNILSGAIQSNPDVNELIKANNMLVEKLNQKLEVLANSVTIAADALRQLFEVKTQIQNVRQTLCEWNECGRELLTNVQELFRVNTSSENDDGSLNEDMSTTTSDELINGNAVTTSTDQATANPAKGQMTHKSCLNAPSNLLENSELSEEFSSISTIRPGESVSLDFSLMQSLLGCKKTFDHPEMATVIQRISQGTSQTSENIAPTATNGVGSKILIDQTDNVNSSVKSISTSSYMRDCYQKGKENKVDFI